MQLQLVGLSCFNALQAALAWHLRMSLTARRHTVCEAEEVRDCWMASLPPLLPFWKEVLSRGSSDSPFPPLGSTNSPIWCQLSAVYSVP